jgi:hypothetical protein
MHREMLLSQPQTPENHRHSSCEMHSPVDYEAILAERATSAADRAEAA